MQEQFEDLIIDNSGKKDKQKALLFKIILFIVIVLIVALAYKIFSGSSTSPAEPRAQLQPEERFESMQTTVQEVADDDFAALSERLAEQTGASVMAPAAMAAQEPTGGADLGDKPANNLTKTSGASGGNTVPSASAAVAANIPAAADKPSVVSAKPISAAAAKPAAINPPPAKAVLPAAPKPAPAQKPAAPKPAPIAQKQERSVFDELTVHKPAAPAQKPAAKRAQPASSAAPATSASGTYVQVYAGKKIDPKSHELKNLTKLGLQYKIVAHGGVERVIVGPYSAADKMTALAFVREHVRKDAFFYVAK